MVKLTSEILKQYRSAIYNQMSGCYELMNEFKFSHAEEYKIISTMYRKRVAIKDSINAMGYLKDNIYWFTLTFNNKKDKSAIQTKRKAAMTFLNDLAACYLLVEEFGEDNGRYHIHGFLVFRYGKSFLDFKKWHSRQNIVLLGNSEKVSKRVYYLTNYACKSVPRIRRSKSLVALTNRYKKSKGLLRCGFDCVVNDNMNECIEKSVNFF